MGEWELASGFVIRKMEKERFFELFNQYRKSIFGEDHSLFFQDYISGLEKDKINSLREQFYHKPFGLHLGVFDQSDNFVGWSFGFQENASTYYMCNSAILPDYRRKGLYTALLNKSLEILKDKGFQLIYSRHSATNNSILIPKLKAGFVIGKMELCDVFGVLIHLRYYTNQTRRKVLSYRAGEIKPDNELKELFKLS